MIQIPGLICVDSKMIIKKDDDVDVGCGNAFGSGGEEDEGGAAGGGPQKVNNIIDGFNYTGNIYALVFPCDTLVYQTNLFITEKNLSTHKITSTL